MTGGCKALEVDHTKKWSRVILNVCIWTSLTSQIIRNGEN